MFLSKFLQGIECDLLEATKECKTVIELLRAERLDESVWDEVYQSALDLSEPFDIVENMPRRCGRQTTRANHLADTPKQYRSVCRDVIRLDNLPVWLARNGKFPLSFIEDSTLNCHYFFVIKDNSIILSEVKII